LTLISNFSGFGGIHIAKNSEHHAPTVKPEAATAVVELLMMA
jgi:hypothetical protein